MAKKRTYLTIGELFCGPGGGGIGASMARLETKEKIFRFKHLWATDYDKDSCETYRNNISKYEKEKLKINSKVNVIHGDINDLNLEDTDLFPSVNGLIFGFPCNDFSLVGESKGLKGEFGPLYKHGVRILKREDNPDWFIAENVSGLASANAGEAFDQICQELTDSGYRLTAHKYRFEEYGIPQARHRIIIVGIADRLNLQFSVPKPSGVIMTAGEALADIPEELTHQELTRQSQQVIERLKHIKPGENAWNANLPDHLKLNVPNTRLSHIYKRLNKNKPAYTVTGSGGGGTHMYHWEEPRALTNRERARIQTFPDTFEFSGTKESVRKQIGMAIPAEGLKIICEALLKTLSQREYPKSPSNIKIKTSHNRRKKSKLRQSKFEYDGQQ
ncbi:DNA cytosine methyltransferase [Planctomycetota bacterium]|nr:DNA cytosine methyltransferase [Planctomycetota bacterium]